MDLSETMERLMKKTVLKCEASTRTYTVPIHHAAPATRSHRWWYRGSIQFVLSTLAVFCCFLLTSCGLFNVQLPSPHTSPPVLVSPGPINHPVVTRGCGHSSSVASGSSADQTIAVNPAESLGHRARRYRVHVPTDYQDTTPYALILYFHGFGGTAEGADRGSGFSAFADQHHFIVAYGQGLPIDEQHGPAAWTSEGPIDYGIDDVHYVSLMLDDLQSKLCIDAHCIFVTGISNGGSMSDYLASRLAVRIAAVAPVAGNFYYFSGGYRPSRPVPILDIHGTADTAIPYQGIPTSAYPPWPLPSIPQWLQGWSIRDGCQQGPIVFLRTTQVMGERWTHCRGNAEVVHYRIEGGGHSLPRMLGSRTSLEVMWDFFQSHPLPEQS